MGKDAKDSPGKVRHAKGKGGETGGIAGRIVVRNEVLRVVRGAEKAVRLSRSFSL